MKKKIAVIGVGSAGIQTLCQMLVWTDESYEITSIYDPKIGILGIGESTNPTFVEALELGLDFSILEDTKNIDGTLKVGIKYKKWRDNEFTNPLLQGALAIHFNTNKLVEFAMPRLRERWSGKFKEILGNVTAVKNLEDRVNVTVNGNTTSYDYLIDCSGFPKDFTEYNSIDMAVNHCLVHNVYGTTNEWLYTGHVATPDGWMFEIPLTTRVSYGYLFNDTITDIETAKQNFSKEINVPVDQLGDIAYKFNSYSAKKIFNGRILKNGNKAVFFEPLFSNSLWFYNHISVMFFEYLKGEKTVDEINNQFDELTVQVEELIWYNYHGGSTVNSPFWKQMKARGMEKIKHSVNLARVQDGLKEMNRTRDWGTIHRDLKWVYNALNLTIADKKFGYNYFQP